MKIMPQGDRVLVRKDKARTETDSGILLTESEDKKSQIVTVEAIGDGVELSLHEGDRVMVSSFSGQGVDLGDEDLCMLRASEVVAVVRDEHKVDPDQVELEL